MANENGDVIFQKPGAFQQVMTVGSDVVGNAVSKGWKGLLIGLAVFAALTVAGGAIGVWALTALSTSVVTGGAMFGAGAIGAAIGGFLGFGAIGTGLGAGAAWGAVTGPSRGADQRAATQMQVHGISPSRGAAVAVADARQQNAMAQNEYNSALQQLQYSSAPVIPMVGQQQQALLSARQNNEISKSSAIA